MNKNGFTLIEMLVVLSVIMTTTYVSLSIHQPQIILHDVVLNQIVQTIEKARSQALIYQTKQSLIFMNHSLYINHQEIYTEKSLLFLDKKEISFNSNGHISQGITIPFKINQKSYQLIFNVGQGAYRIEKT